MILKNFTPHPIVLTGLEKALESTGIARCAVETRCVDDSDCTGSSGTVSFVCEDFGEVTGLPKPEPEVVFVVSRIVRDAANAAGRTDVACPACLIRDGGGRIIGCGALAWGHI